MFHLQFVAEYTQKHLLKNIASNINSNEAEHHREVLTKQILNIDEEILKLVKRKADISGIFICSFNFYFFFGGGGGKWRSGEDGGFG